MEEACERKEWGRKNRVTVFSNGDDIMEGGWGGKGRKGRKVRRERKGGGGRKRWKERRRRIKGENDGRY